MALDKLTNRRGHGVGMRNRNRMAGTIDELEIRIWDALCELARATHRAVIVVGTMEDQRWRIQAAKHGALVGLVNRFPCPRDSVVVGSFFESKAPLPVCYFWHQPIVVR
jgi:hypothetical protein